jgi:hypothetical protein
MLKLFVDDWRTAPPGWLTARTITGAIEVLSQGQVRCLSLDNDIQNVFGDLCIPPQYRFSLETYSAVARYVAIMAPAVRPRLIFLHTANLEAACLMRDVLMPTGAQIVRVDPEYYLREIQDHLRRGRRNCG